MGRPVSRNVTLEMGQASLEAKRKMDRQRIFLPRRPEDDFPELPEDPTELGDSELMRLFVQLTKWSEYLGAQLAVAEVDERYADASLEQVKAVKSLGSTSKTVSGAKAAAMADPDYQAAQQDYNERHAYRKLVHVSFINAERNSALLSRELTRRVNRTEREGRSDRWGGG